MDYGVQLLKILKVNNIVFFIRTKKEIRSTPSVP